MRFNLFQIPVYIHPTFWIFLLFFTNLFQGFSAQSLLVAAIIFVSLLVHECGHALTAKYFGAQPVIVLEAFGGRAEYNSQGLTPKQRFLITLNGPLLESILIILPYTLLKLGIFASSPYLIFILKVTFQLNALWCCLNLIPIAPLDGGHLIAYFFERWFGQKGIKASVYIGIATATLALPYLYYKGYLLFSSLLLFFVIQNVQLLFLFKRKRKGRTASSSAPRKAPFARYLEALQLVKEKDYENAKKELKILLRCRDAHVKTLSIEALAKIYAEEENKKEAYALLMQADPSSLKEGKRLLCELAFEAGNYLLVAKYSRKLYDLFPSYEIASLNSRAYAFLKEPVLAGAWLETTSQFRPDPKQFEQLLKDPAYQGVCDDAAFKSYLDKISPLTVAH